MRRWLAVVATVLLAGVWLGGCYWGPLPTQYAALAVVDGRPTAVVAACGRTTVHVEVYLNDPDSPGDLDNTLHQWAVTVTLADPVRDVEVELLGAARPGWEITSHPDTVGTPPYSFDIAPLTSIDPGHRYSLDSSTGGPEGASAPKVTFTTDDLTKIGPGQVLAVADHAHLKVISRDSFVKKLCH